MNSILNLMPNNDDKLERTQFHDSDLEWERLQFFKHWDKLGNQIDGDLRVATFAYVKSLEWALSDYAYTHGLFSKTSALKQWRALLAKRGLRHPYRDDPRPYWAR